MSDSGSPRFQVWSWRSPSKCRSRSAEGWAGIRAPPHRLGLRWRRGRSWHSSRRIFRRCNRNHRLQRRASGPGWRRKCAAAPPPYFLATGPVTNSKSACRGLATKPNAQAFDIVERIIERMDLQLATVARPGVNGSNAQRPAENFKNARLQGVNNTQCLVTRGRRLGDDPDAADLAQRFQHGYRSCPL